ncbi:hypothetical protein V6N12_063759 [Hibiscus sabdariffa]|uniref:Uncharacterized protein n=1 Tax=Hibiscus sabdariffa TaxID=183260 RepID=A0ABR2B785_9ROSI
MLHKTETELPKQHAILKPQAGQASEVEANAERQPKHPHGDNHLCYGAGVEPAAAAITKGQEQWQPRPAPSVTLAQPSQPSPMSEDPH